MQRSRELASHTTMEPSSCLNLDQIAARGNTLVEHSPAQPNSNEDGVWIRLCLLVPKHEGQTDDSLFLYDLDRDGHQELLALAGDIICLDAPIGYYYGI